MTVGAQEKIPGQLFDYGGAVMNVKHLDIGCVGDGVTDDTVALQRAFDLGVSLYFPPGTYMTQGGHTLPTASSADDMEFVGAGIRRTFIELLPASNQSILVTSNENRYHWRHFCFNGAKVRQTSGDDPAVWLKKGYFHSFYNMKFYGARGSGLKIGDDIFDTFNNALFIGTWFRNNKKDGLEIVNCQKITCIGCVFEYNGYDEGDFPDPPPYAGNNYRGGILYRNNLSHHSYVQSTFTSNRFEGNQAYSADFEGMWGMQFNGNYVYAAPIFLGRDTSHNELKNNMLLLASRIHDGGFNNTIGPNDGQAHHLIYPVERYYPSSWLTDSKMERRDTAKWTTTNASLTKYDNQFSLGENKQGKGRMKVSASASNGNAYQDVDNLLTRTYIVEVYAHAAPGNQFRILVETVGGTPVHDSGPISPVVDFDANVRSSFARERCFRSSAFNSGGSATLRVRLMSVTSGENVWFSEARFFESPNQNGSFEGTYSGGVAPNWSSFGTGTFAEESTIKLAGSAAQKITVAAGNFAIVEQSLLSIDYDRLYLVRGGVYVVSGVPVQCGIGWGRMHDGGPTGRQFKLNPTKIGEWQYLSNIFKPDLNTVLSCGIEAGEATVAIFDNVNMFPLKYSAEGTHIAVSPTLVLDSTTLDQVIIARPNISGRMIRAGLIYTEAAGSGATAIVTLGRVGVVDYFGSITTALSAPFGTETAFTLTRTDIRADQPLIATCDGQADGGQVQVFIEYE